MAKIFNFPPKMAKYLKNIFLNKKIFPLPLIIVIVTIISKLSNEKSG